MISLPNILCLSFTVLQIKANFIFINYKKDPSFYYNMVGIKLPTNASIICIRMQIFFQLYYFHQVRNLLL